MNIDAAIDDAVLALFCLTLMTKTGHRKASIGDVLNRLYECGMIGNPLNKTKSVVLTDEGLRESERLIKQHFVRSSSKDDH
ncbi:hypothetical protein OKW33_006539 [Paraburkholderia atlantica]|uniref:DUF6429 domain-containing protein n=1 Tax=Paraburkholderia atlantica TaxID=2654982 RepID=A0A7W8QGG3_PARAM|nr:DUF6429 family protein [Paraburkholderia atlantica]MBB5421698.1 hypothetical protein [Paraburkholderia atlantica]MBB5429554.1 hypothetical protein [Paraburkholderia atlantica]